MSRNAWVCITLLAFAVFPQNLDARSLAPLVSEKAQLPRQNQSPHEELPSALWMPRSGEIPPGVQVRCEPVVLGPYKSVQVNVDEFGCNIPGDAANEPSIAIDPTNPRRMAIGWRQFDTVEGDFRQAGWGFSRDGGHSWVFPGVLQPGVFGSDPVLGADSSGRFFYQTLDNELDLLCSVFRSLDGGQTWIGPVFAYGYDKPWMVVDRSGGIGDGNIYVAAVGSFARSVDHGFSFQDSPDLGIPTGNMAIGPLGELYLGLGAVSYDAQDAKAAPTAEPLGDIDWQAAGVGIGPPNFSGLIGQKWIDCDVSNGPYHGNVYAIGHFRPLGTSAPYPCSLLFVRSTDGGNTWSEPVRINNDPEGNGAWHWFGMMSVAPNGRIDIAWNDTRNTGLYRLSQLYYAYSEDAGVTWIGNVPVSPIFDSYVGWPGTSRKLGDYYHMISDNLGVNIAYAATFNGEQDIYFLRIGPYDCNGNEIPDEDDIDDGASLDCNTNEVPDECEYRGDFNGNRLTALDDYLAYTQCRTAPGVEYSTPCCGLFDIEPDGDVDLADFAFVQRAFAVLQP